MKKRITALLLLFTLSVTSLLACTSADKPESATGKTSKTSKSINDKKTDLTPVTLNEVAHSIFYAPMYVAMEKNYFEKEGIDLSLVTGFGADKTMTAVLSGTADIGFMGSEAGSIWFCFKIYSNTISGMPPFRPPMTFLPFRSSHLKFLISSLATRKFPAR